MKKTIAIFGVLGVFILFNGANQNLSAQVLQQDSLALVALYDSTDGANWTDNTNWLTRSVSTWFGITVSDGRVTGVILRSNNLVGTIPAEIGNLTELTILDLYTNQLSGSIPPEIGNLTKLTKLNLHRNQLTGSIPPEIGNLTKLVYWYMRNNQLTGSISPEIGNLTKLKDLYLNGNQFTGTIPPEIYNLTSLINLDLYGNQLTDTIATELGNLTNLESLNFSANQLTGTIPIEIGNLTNLTLLSLGMNQLTDTIPSAIGNLTNLRYLYLAANQLVGTIPEEIGNLTKLENLYLHKNQISGSIPAEFGKLTNLKYLYLSDNKFIDLPDLSADTLLIKLQIHNNKFTFEDIEPNIFVTDFIYSPQDSVGEQQDTTIDQGTNLELSVTVGGTANQYQWMKDGVAISGADSSSYTIHSVDSSAAGTYLCKITNTIATDLTLYSRPINVSVSNVTGITDHPISSPKIFTLYQNYPNPFNPSTRIKYNLPQASPVTLKIYNLQGQEITTLVNEFQTAGMKSVVWDGADNQGQRVSSGIYFYRLEADEFRTSRKMILAQ